ncbi:MAG: hypothetical protein IJU66_02385, partial [Oscillospiraceae bacterium]|nr:hypothetical protein [Oscillospiraceae bacterium]
YWHGSLALVRPLLAALTLRQIYALCGAALALLAAALLALLLRQRAYASAAGVFAGMLATAFWFVPLSLEYVWACLLALILSLFAVRRREPPALLFLFGGMLTGYFDFLTAETLTLTLPLLLALRPRREGETPEPVGTAWRGAVSWGFGYVGMWTLTWALAAAILRENVMPYITEHISERLGGTIAGVGPLRRAAGAIGRNIMCLFPVGWGVAGALAGLAVVLGAAYYGYVYRRPGADKRRLAVYAAVGLVPYLRYLALRNHSYLHCFFTYRAQLATVLAIALILAELTDKSRRSAEGRARKKSKNRAAG